MIHLNMDMMKNEMMLLVMALNNKLMNNQNHKVVHLVLVMMDTYMMIVIVALLFGFVLEEMIFVNVSDVRKKESVDIYSQNKLIYLHQLKN